MWDAIWSICSVLATLHYAYLWCWKLRKVEDELNQMREVTSYVLRCEGEELESRIREISERDEFYAL